MGALLFLAGVAALSWEVLWQLEASLAIGVSAKGTALTLATTMGGMALGSWLAGRILGARRALARPLVVYGALECVVGVSGVALLLPGLAFVERLDTSLFAARPQLAVFARIAGIACVLGPPAVAMGATIPVIGLLARRARTSLSLLYAINTAGACAGVLLASFVFLPYLGVEVTTVALACVNLGVGAAAILSSRREVAEPAALEPPTHTREAPPREIWVVLVATGFVSFALEVIWFRALRAAFQATTHGFAVMLAAVLLALAGGARLAAWLDRRSLGIGVALAGAGVATLVATPVIERFDGLAAATVALASWQRVAVWFLASLAAVGPGMLLLGACLPWVLDRHVDAAHRGRAYAANTLAAVTGSLAAAWVLLPLLGLARSAWVLGGAASALGVLLLPGRAARARAAAAVVGGLAIAMIFESGVGRTRVMSNIGAGVARVVAFEEGADSTVAVAEGHQGTRVLLIDGFAAAFGPSAGAHYMVWMGRLPMLLHPSPKDALVICFGTGQTANAVRTEGPARLDIVDVNAAVFRMAPYFDANDKVLEDPRVHPVVMDGRAWLRRSERRYDVITLEPMAPTFAGVNALYSKEFYDLAERRMNPGGVIAQWVPFHILSVDDAVAIVATFQRVFPDAILWLDPLGATGIVVGRKPAGPGVAPASELGSEWPGLSQGGREGILRDLPADVVRRHVVLRARGVAAYASLGAVVTDDNQLLSYGPRRYRFFEPNARLDAANLAVLSAVADRFIVPATPGSPK